MPGDFLIDINDFGQGLQLLGASQDAPIGSARVMNNMVITDRFGIGPRPGTAILGTYDAGTTGCDGFYNFLTTVQGLELPVKDSNGIKKYFHPTLLDWAQLKSGYTVGAEFGSKEHLVNTDNQDYLYFCNAKENPLDTFRYHDKWRVCFRYYLDGRFNSKRFYIGDRHGHGKFRNYFNRFHQNLGCLPVYRILCADYQRRPERQNQQDYG